MTHISDTFVTQWTPISDIVCSYLWHWVTLSWHRALIAHPPIIYPGWHRHPVGKRSWFRRFPILFLRYFVLFVCFVILHLCGIDTLNTGEGDCQSTKTSGPSNHILILCRLLKFVWFSQLDFSHNEDIITDALPLYFPFLLSPPPPPWPPLSPASCPPDYTEKTGGASPPLQRTASHLLRPQTMTKKSTFSKEKRKQISTCNP